LISISDPFNFVTAVVGSIIAKGLANIGRGIKAPSNYLIQYFNHVRKIGPWSNKIKQMQKQNTEDTQYKRDTDLRGSPSVGYVHQRNFQVLPLLLSNK
jgi:hypothetical protein